MKIVIVLCSIATFAIAVPVHQEKFIESSLTNQPLRKREAKSALPDTSGLPPEDGIEKSPIDSTKKLGHGTSIEAKGFRRPIIIKRKFAYHVYRDSDEEMAHAEPGERCREQVKFKLCDHEPVLSSKNGIKTPTFKCVDDHKTDDEMKNSIKMTKEAVEHLQRDLKRMGNFSPKMVSSQIEDIESNIGLYHDIEIAREAIEHIEQNFKTVNSEVNKFNELQIPKSQGEERLNRWREAIDNIHKNFEIVKNIEDALKSDNHYSSILPNAGKANQPEAVEHSFKDKFTNDNLYNKDESYTDDIKLKSAANKVRLAQPTPNNDNLVNIGKDAENDMFISSTDNREVNMQLHSDSLKSEINSKDASLRSDVSEIESEKISSEYSPKNTYSFFEVPKYSEHEKTTNDHISDKYELLPKVSSSSLYSLHEDEKNEEKKTLDKSQLMMKTALQERENRNPIIKMKTVKEILENKKDQLKTATSNEEYIINYDEMFFKSNNKNNPLEGLSSVPVSRIAEASGNLGYGSEEKKYFYKENENKENQPIVLNTNMRLSNDLLEKSKQLPVDSFVTKDQYIMESPHVFALNEKNALSGEDNGQNEHKNKQIIKENQVFNYSPKDSEIEDEVEKFKNVHEYNDVHKSIESSDGHDKQESLRKIQNQELKNDDSLVTVVKTEPEFYKTVSDADNEDILNDREQSHQHIKEQIIPMSIYQSKNANQDPKWSLLKSVPELPSELPESLPTNRVKVTDDQQSYKEKASVRSSENQNENMQSNENREMLEHLPTRLDNARHSEEHSWQSPKSVDELIYDPTVSISRNTDDITDDQHSIKEDPSMRFSQIQNEKLQLKGNQEFFEPSPQRSNSESYQEEHTSQFLKSVPELQSYQTELLPKDEVEVTDDQQSYREKASMRSSENQNDKIQSNENQEMQEHLPMRLDNDRHSEERSWQSSKSVDELLYDTTVSISRNTDDIIDDRQSYKEEASMRSSEKQFENMELNENQEVPEPLPKSLYIKNAPESHTWQFSKSVPELNSDLMVSMPTDTVDITNDQNSIKEDLNMRSSQIQNKILQLNGNQELSDPSPPRLNSESYQEEHITQFLKSVPELQSHRTQSLVKDEAEVTDDQQSYREKASMRSSENQNEKIQSNENQKIQEHLPMRLDNDRHSEERSWQSPKSVDELLYDTTVSFSRNTGDITDDKQSYKEEASLRSSENQNENMQSNENREMLEHLPTRLDNDRHSEERSWQSPKSVDELIYDPTVSILRNTDDITDDQHSIKEDPSMRFSQIQNEKLQLKGNQEFSEPSPQRLNSESYQEDHTSQFLKSVPELQSYLTELLPKDEAEVTDDQQSYREKASMRSSETQNEKIQSNENQEIQEHLPMRLDNDRHSEERSWQSPKSVDELLYGTTVSISRNTDDIIDDRQSYKEEASMRSSEKQFENMELRENIKAHEPLPMRSNLETQSEERSWQSPKFVDELSYNPMVSIPTNTVNNRDNQHSYTGEASIRSSDNQNENQKIHEGWPMTFDFEKSPKNQAFQFFKSVPELLSDLTEPLPKDKVDVTNDQQSYTEIASMRSSENRNKNMQSNENQEIQEHLTMSLDNNRHLGERSWQSPKSVDELSYDPKVSMPLNIGEISNNQNSYKEIATWRASDKQFEKMRSNKNLEVHEHLPMKWAIEAQPEEGSWQSPKFVDELSYDPMKSMPTKTDDVTDNQYSDTDEASIRSSENQNEKLAARFSIENNPEDRIGQYSKSVSEPTSDPIASMPTDKVTDNQHFVKSEVSMRLSQYQNEKLQLNEYQEEPKYRETSLDIENSSEEKTTSQLSKSASESQSDQTKVLIKDTVDITDDQHSREASMTSSDKKYENIQPTANREIHETLPTRLNIENHPEDQTWQISKSVSESASDPMVSMPKDNVEITEEQHAINKENMRIAQNQNEKWQLNEYEEEPKYAATGIENENNSEERTTSQLSKSASESQSDQTKVLITETVDVTNDQHSREASMRSPEKKYENIQHTDNQDIHETFPTRLNLENHPEDQTWQMSKSVPESTSDSIVLMPTDNVEITNKQHSTNEGSMRLSQNQNEKLQLREYQGEPKYTSTSLDIENIFDDTSQFSKSASESQSDHTKSLNTDTADITNAQNSHEANMRSSENIYEKIQPTDSQEIHATLPTRLNIENHPEDQTWQMSKSVPESTSDPMVSMPTDNVEITNEQHSINEGNLRISQNQNEKWQLNEYEKGPKYAASRLKNEKNSEDRTTSQLSKSASESQSDRTKVLITDSVDVTNDQHSHEASMRSSEKKHENIHPTESQEIHETLSTRLNIENHPEDQTWKMSKSVSESASDPMVSMPTDNVEITEEQHSINKENMRIAQNQNEKWQLNEEEPKYAATGLENENNSEDRTTSQLSKSASESQSDQTKGLITETVDVTNDQHSREASMRSPEKKYENIQPTKSQEIHETLSTRLNIENNPEDQTWQKSKSVPEWTSDPMVSMPTDNVEITKEQHSINKENMRIAQNQNEKWQLNEYEEEPKYAATGLENENNSEDRTTSQLSKSASESQSDQTKGLITETVDVTNDQHSREASMSTPEKKYENIQPTKSQEIHETLSTRLNIENNPEDQTWQKSKSVPEWTSDPMVSMPTDNVEITKEQHSINKENMRIAQNQNEKWQLNEYEEEPKYAATGLENENNSEDRTTSHLSKSASESQSDQTKGLITETVDVTNDQHSREASMRSPEKKYENIQPTKSQEIHETLSTKLNIENHPEDQTWQMSKSVPESASHPMVSMPTDNVEITNEQNSINEGNMRVSQNQNDRSRFDEINSELSRTSQFFKSAPESYMTPTDLNYVNNENPFFKEEARLSQNPNQGQHIILNHNLYDPLWAIANGEKSLGDDSSQTFKSVSNEHMLPIAENEEKFRFIQDPIKEQTFMRFSQNENDKNEIQSFSNEYINKEDNRNVMHDHMHLRVAHPQQLYENSDPFLQSSKDRQHFRENYQTLPEYKMFSPKSQLEYSNEQNAFNEHLNMRINQLQSRDPESVENPNLHNLVSMRWNTENQHRNPSPKTFQPSSGFDHTLHRGKQFDYDHTRPELYGDRVLDNTQSSRWFNAKQNNDNFLNYYKTIPEAQEEYLNPYYNQHLHRVPVHHGLNDGDAFSSIDFQSSNARLHDHMQKYHQEKASNVDSPIQPSMHMNMREPFAISGTEVNDVHFKHPHGTARFGTALPIGGIGPGAMGVFPTANAGCGIPLLLSCNPSVISGSLARSHIGIPGFKSADENYKYYMKRNAKNIEVVPDINVQKASVPHTYDKNAVTGI